MKLLTSSKTMLEDLSSMGINDSSKLMSYIPYRYEVNSYSDEKNLGSKQKLVLLGRIVSNPKLIHVGKMTISSFHFISSNNHLYNVKAFNQPYVNKIINLSDEFTLMGVYSKEGNQLSLTKIKKGLIPEEDKFKGVYHLPSSMQDSAFTKLMKKTFETYENEIKDEIPSYLIDKYKLLHHKDALKGLHFPLNEEIINSSRRTLKFEECLEFCLKNRIIREQNKKMEKVIVKDIDTLKINQFILSLPYKLSSDQTKAVREIILDMKNKSSMYRLLQGDVGTGKTLVATICLYGNYLRDNQGVLLAPTDSLARQHYDNVTKLLEPYGIKVELLVGSLSNKEKKDIQQKVLNHQIDVLIGTHAVFSKELTYSNLGLAIIDEQHRFGVNQRNILASKGDQVDLLLMSATPIPRTLSLSIYGDLDVSSLTNFPNGKRNVKTIVCDYEDEIIERMTSYCVNNNHQVFMVCPKIETNVSSKSKSAKEIYEKYKLVYQDKIALLHGKMKENDKIELIDKFSKGEILILVATSIVELGIDIKSSMGMIVFSASNFGLASLHQLRGRVGRDGNKAYCLLVDELVDQEKVERLKFLENCDDGFLISEEDMRLRGPGDFTGFEQSGFPSFNCLNIVTDFKMFEVARDEASYIYHHLDDDNIYSYFLKVYNMTIDKEIDIPLFD